ncbi:MAG: hypothetical protein HC913_02070 [Microscillaceae bacterium]|nr:hypothetical protein [Microscillaceae bacterium]
MTYFSTHLAEPLQNLAQEAETRSREIDELRALPADLMGRLKASSVLRLWVAQAYGGHQATVLDLLQAIETCAYYNGSLAWIVAVTGTAALGSGYLPPEAAQAIFGPSDAMTGGWAAPVGQARRVAGGLRVSGRWAWGSGTPQASHIVGGVMVSDASAEKPFSALAYFSPAQVQFHDNWHVLGMRGSQSIDYEVEEAFVPEGYWMPFPVKKPWVEATLYRFSFLGALAAGVASVGLGLAHRAWHEIKALSLQKVPQGAGRTLSERPVVHDQLARMQAAYQSARLYLHEAMHQNWQAAEQGFPDPATKSALRLAATYAAETALQIVQQAYHLGGGSSIWEGVKLQELLRDAQVMSQHGLIAPPNYEVAGRVAFELPVNAWLL